MLAEDYIPIFLEEENFSPKDNLKVIKFAFINQYGENADFDEFMQLNFEKKVLIVDGYDKIKKERWNIFVEELDDKFGHIILFGGIDWNLNIKERTLKELSESFNRFLIISLDVLICRYSPLFRAFPALFISEEPHKSFYYPSCFHSQK